MTGIRYKIPMLSARAMLAFAKPLGEDVYSFTLNKAETTSVLLNHGETYQDDNAVFYQLMSMLHRDGYSPKEDELIIDDLYDAIIYLDSLTFTLPKYPHTYTPLFCSVRKPLQILKGSERPVCKKGREKL